MASGTKRWPPRVVGLRWRGWAWLGGLRPAVPMPGRWCTAAQPPARLREAPRRSNPTCVARGVNAGRPCGNRAMAGSGTGAPGRGATTSPWWSVRTSPGSPGGGLAPASPRPAPLGGPRCWSPRHGGSCGRGALRPREGPHGPRPRARAPQHRPHWPRLWRRSGRAGPVSPWGRLAQAGSSTASRSRAPTR
jgi:hypothetical protein